MKHTPDTIDEATIRQFAKLTQQASAEWAEVQATSFDLAAYGRSAQQQTAFPSLLKAEQAAIDRLQTALDSREKAQILAAARAIKPPFAKTFMYFGDFPN